jgi:hypothetical protein
MDRQTDGHEGFRTQDRRQKEDVDKNHELESIRGAKLTNILCVLPRLRMDGAVPPLIRLNRVLLN